jgi:ATP phosphoribosyltransferase
VTRRPAGDRTDDRSKEHVPEMLRIAVPNKGTLSAPASHMLREAGYRQRTDAKDLACRDEDNDVEFFYLRPRDIATYVGSGDLDLGITGRDLLLDAGSPAAEVLDLDFGSATFRLAARPETLSSADDIGGRRIATAYPGVVERHLAERGLKADVIRLDGAVENAVRLGVADVIADVVETGATLRQAGLVTVGEPILRSSAILIGRRGPDGSLAGAAAAAVPALAADPPRGRTGGAAQLVRRLQGVLVARRYVMLAYDVRADLLDEATALTPGIESPTVSPLHREGWVAVQAMVLRRDVHRIMDELYDLGARAILVTDIHNCRL